MDHIRENPYSSASIFYASASLIILPLLFGFASIILGIIGIAKNENEKLGGVIGIIMSIYAMRTFFI